jgi:hypothetical protein
MLKYARIFAYQTDMNLIGRDGRTDTQTTLLLFRFLDLYVHFKGLLKIKLNTPMGH